MDAAKFHELSAGGFGGVIETWLYNAKAARREEDEALAGELASGTLTNTREGLPLELWRALPDSEEG